MKRREFLKWTGMTAAGSLLSACGNSAEKLIPFLVPPDDGSVPGVAHYYASSCRQCPAGCGILVRVDEGRAKKIEGNPLHPVNKGKLCARGQASLQELYHPDRIRRPMKRTGPRGSGAFTPISWDEGMELFVGHLKELRTEGKTEELLLMTPRLQGSLLDLVGTFIPAYGSPRHLSYELLNTECYEQAFSSIYGRSDLPDYDFEKTQYLLSFGADFLETYGSPVRYGHAFGRMRQARPTIRGTFTYVGGRMSMTAASADRWLPVKTGEEGTLALGMARLIIQEELYDQGAVSALKGDLDPWKKMLEAYDLERVTEATGLSKDEVHTLARNFAEIRPSLALAGDSVAFQSNGKNAVRAIHFLNLLVGNVGREGGVLFPPEQDHPRSGGSFSDLRKTIDDMQQEKIQLALIYRTNPVYSLPPSLGFQEGLQKVPHVISFSSILDDSARYADLVLPDHTDLESWGDAVPWEGIRSKVTGVLQPVVKPLYDTRPFPDVLLAAARGLGEEVGGLFPYKNALKMVEHKVRKTVKGPPGESFERLWIEVLQRGGIFEEETPSLIAKKREVPLPSEVHRPRFAGDASTYPFHLLLFPSPAIYDGRQAHLPWLQEMPDPMSTAVWGPWVELHPESAKKLGIKHGDLVEVESQHGAVRVPAVIFPAIRPDLVALPMGHGHHGMGRYADGVGANPLSLLVPEMDRENNLPAWGATRVRVTRISDKGDLVVMGHPEGSYRGELLGI